MAFAAGRATGTTLWGDKIHAVGTHVCSGHVGLHVAEPAGATGIIGGFVPVARSLPTSFRIPLGDVLDALGGIFCFTFFN